ncbi:MAG: acyl-CoA dehydrogenase family protein [Chloroflexota bacterium]|nr:acyl-CoA dehydrogenase family protein [Chloroflexota bacterium]
MNLDFTEEQDMLRNSARDFLSTECDKMKVREIEEGDLGYSPEIWGKTAELGWQGLMIPDEYDGMGMGLIDLVVIFEEIGYNILPSPFLATVALATPPIVEAGSEEMKKEILPKVAAGEAILTMALTEPSAGYTADCVELKAEDKGDSFVLNGTKLFVEYASAAAYLVVVARTKSGSAPEAGITLFLVDAKAPGLKIEPFETTGTDKQCEVVFENVSVPKSSVIGEADKGWPLVQNALRIATIAKCAEMVGGMAAAQDMSVAYAKEREQYGRPIGSYQAMQHKLAEIYLNASMSKNILYEAAWMAQEGMDCDWKISCAKGWCNEAYRSVTEEGAHVHGAIGTTRDHDMGLYYRRARAAYSTFGDTEDHREVVAKSLGL